MGARSDVLARPVPRLARADGQDVATVARWLLAAVALDLVVTRLLVRLAIFVPKGEPWASLAAVTGRVGATVDALVPIVALGLLAVLLLGPGRALGAAGRVAIACIAGVAVGGLALLLSPPTPLTALAVELLVVGAVGSALLAMRPGHGPVPGRAGIVVLGAATILVAAARALDATGAIAGSAVPWPEPAVTLTLGAWGQLGYVAGAALVGLAGLRAGSPPGGARAGTGGGAAALGLVVGGLVLLAAWWAPATLGTLAIWSLGVGGAIPGGLIAITAGLLVAGLPGLHARSPSRAIGAAIAILAGFGLAASGLVLATVLGLLVAATAPGDAAPPGDRSGA